MDRTSTMQDSLDKSESPFLAGIKPLRPMAYRLAYGRGGQLSNTPPPTTFTLAPGGKAQFQISYGDLPVGGETCVTPKTGDLGLPREAPGAWQLFWQRSDHLCNAGELDVTAAAPVS